jgi:hypothetical protein
MEELIKLGTWSEEKLDRILRETWRLSDPSNKIAFLSKEFLETPYNASTLIGNGETSEVFVINLEHVDCFTYLDYVEAMRLSQSYNEFVTNLQRIRYRAGRVSYPGRNHFFTDWIDGNKKNVRDITGEAGSGKSRKITKTLNDKGNGTYYLSAVPCRQRVITYVPTDLADESVMTNLKTGDYIGIYSGKKGLDVSHVGIFIRDENRCAVLRHASSRYMKVMDEDFSEYIQDTPGILIFRAEPS